MAGFSKPGLRERDCIARSGERMAHFAARRPARRFGDGSPMDFKNGAVRL
jgi:hypothetical protein